MLGKSIKSQLQKPIPANPKANLNYIVVRRPAGGQEQQQEQSRVRRKTERKHWEVNEERAKLYRPPGWEVWGILAGLSLKALNSNAI